jgi:uncharacterized protein (TIRG00374 family)
LWLERLRALMRRKSVQVIVNCALGAVMLVLFVRSVPLRALASHLRPEHAELFAALAALLLLGQLARAFRWRLLVTQVAQVGFGDAFCINAATQLFNYMIPVRAGEAIRLLWLNRTHKVSAGTAAGILVIDHTFDLCGVILVLALGLGLRMSAAISQLPAAPGLGAALGGAVVMLAAIAGTAVLGPRVVESRLLPAWLKARIAGHARGFRDGASVARGRRLPALAFASIAAVTLDGLAFAVLFMSLGLAVPVLSAIVTQVSLLFAYLVPSAPGYVGSLEATGEFLLTNGLGLNSSVAAGAIVLWHAIGAVLVLVVGMAAFQRLRAAGELALA